MHLPHVKYLESLLLLRALLLQLQVQLLAQLILVHDFAEEYLRRLLLGAHDAVPRFLLLSFQELHTIHKLLELTFFPRDGVLNEVKLTYSFRSRC